MSLGNSPLPPIATPKKFEDLTGMPARTCQDQLEDGRMPRFDNRLDKDKRGALYVNVVALQEAARLQGQEFVEFIMSRG